MNKEQNKILMSILKLGGGVFCACGAKLEVLDVVAKINQHLILLVNGHASTQTNVPIGYVVYDIKRKCVLGSGTYASQGFYTNDEAITRAKLIFGEKLRS